MNPLHEIQHLLKQYAQSKRLVRLHLHGKNLMLRVVSVGQTMFHAEVMDVSTRLPAGHVHLPVLAAHELFCLDEDNQWLSLERLYNEEEYVPK